jgi:hypothetical protein
VWFWLRHALRAQWAQQRRKKARHNEEESEVSQANKGRQIGRVVERIVTFNKKREQNRDATTTVEGPRHTRLLSPSPSSSIAAAEHVPTHTHTYKKEGERKEQQGALHEEKKRA